MCERAVHINDLELRVNPQKGTWIERDITCDSIFMMNHIRQIGKSIREAHSFLPNDHPVYLFMDNAGGHGKTEIKKQYENILEKEFKIIIEWQVPNSPETNMLDLGVWMALQSLVERIHRGKVMQSHELSKSVMESFEQISSGILTRVYERWKLVMRLIVSGKGTNEVVEDCRGSLNICLLTQDLPTVPDSECEKGYTYQSNLDVDNSDSESESEGETLEEMLGGLGGIDNADERVMLELAFDET